MKFDNGWCGKRDRQHAACAALYRYTVAILYLPYPAGRGNVIRRSATYARGITDLWTLWRMLEINAGNFMEAHNRLERLGQAIEFSTSPYPMMPSRRIALSEIDHKEVLEAADRLDHVMREMGLVVSLISLQHLKETLLRYEVLPETADLRSYNKQETAKLKNYLHEAAGRFRDELSTRTVLVVPYEKADLWASNIPEAISSSFPSAMFDLDEAMKCFCVARYTACAFHSMRATEVALKATQLALEVPLRENDRNWGSILRSIETAIDRKNAEKQQGWASKKVVFEEISVSMKAVKDAWRNPCMHVEKKYTEGEADHIMRFTLALIGKMAAHYDERGKFLT